MKNYLKLAIFLAGAILLFMPPSLTEAYDARCPSTTAGISVTIDGRMLSFTNHTSTCRQIGVAVYRLSSETVRENAFYYSKTFGLQAGQSVAFSVPVPSCAYVVDAIVGEPTQTVYDKAVYGDLLLKEARGGSAQYCLVTNTVTSILSISSRFSPPAGSGPSPKPRPTPSPFPMSVPLPKTGTSAPPSPSPWPKVLSASATPTSTLHILDPATGGDATLLLALAGSALVSGFAVYLLRRSSVAAVE